MWLQMGTDLWRASEMSHDRLRAIAERARRDEPVRNQCHATSRVGGKGNMYGPDEVYRCRKEARHTDRHEDD
jgi:hypothetical protein